MATDVLADTASAAGSTVRRLLLIWQDPISRKFIRVAELDELVDGRYAFHYVAGAAETGFSALVQYPDLKEAYVSSSLPAFFANRVMSRERDSYGKFRHWIGLDAEGDDTPVEVLARTGGPRATDTFHIVDDLRRAPDGVAVSRFLASGIRHIAGAQERLLTVRESEELYLRDEPSNPANPRAILLDAQGGQPVGYVPDWLVSDVHELREVASSVKVIAERVSPEAPPHLRLLCRMEASGMEPADRLIGR